MCVRVCVYVCVCYIFPCVNISTSMSVITDVIYNIMIVVTIQLLHKRHIGNDIATVIFQDPEAKPFCAKKIRLQF